MNRGGGFKVLVQESWLEDIKKFLNEDEIESAGTWRYQINRGKLKVDVATWSDSTLSKFAKYLDSKGDDRACKLSRNVLQQWIDIKSNPDGRPVSKFENVVAGLKTYIEKSERRYIFEQREDDNMVPWFVSDIEYNEANQNHAPNIVISLGATNSGYTVRHGEGRHETLHAEDCRQLTMSQILAAQGYFLETPESIKAYEVEVEKYLKYCNKDGLQMNVSRKAYVDSGWSKSGWRNVEKSGRPAKMVVDPPERERSEVSVHCPFWDKSEEKVWALPIHPILDCFDLEEHADYRVHVNNVEPYVYDVKVGEKLVLPNDMKDFIEVLIEHSKNKFVDIVRGKEGGTIILLEGPPGTGKTLTAEIYSEVMQRPLYKVQSSQLGVDAESVEKQLKEVLQRSERWGAILLIDESDVYIHERGNDINQNAIVGVFLRVLEYYRGVLFMTTNRGTSVDDAIISRLTARFIYQNPDYHAQMRLWSVLAAQNGIKLAKEEIQPIVTKFDKLSGRDIKNLLKLAYVVSLKGNKPINLKLIETIAKFRQTITENS